MRNRAVFVQAIQQEKIMSSLVFLWILAIDFGIPVYFSSATPAYLVDSD